MSGSNKIILPAILSSYRPKVDGSFSISFTTLILNKQQLNVIHEMYQQSCFVLIKSSEVEKAEEAMLDSIDVEFEDTSKTPSQRLRSVLYLLWKQEDANESVTFKEFYRHKMETLLDHFKNKLDK